MVTRRDKDEEFYEAMPGTMQGTHVRRREREVDEADQEDTRISPLAWIGLAALIVLGLFLLGAINSSRSQQNTTGTSSSNGAGAQNMGGSQPGTGNAGSPGAAKNMP